MDLPPTLRQALDELLAGASLAGLAGAARTLSDRYRGEVRDGRLHLGSREAALAYLATRMPATYAAVGASLAELHRRLPELAPHSFLDAGAGPATALLAARDLWPEIAAATLVEASGPIRELGERLLAASGFSGALWREGDLAGGLAGVARHGIVALSYVLDELGAEARARLVSRLWALTSRALVICEPGTSAGWRRILAARGQLIAEGAQILAPCPHAQACPLRDPDWCHFSERLARSRVHRLAKEGARGWEDEKFIYLVAARPSPAVTPPIDASLAEASREAAAGAASTPWSRVLAAPESAKGQVGLKLCTPDGALAQRRFTRREGEVFRRARRVGWGDRFEP